MKNMHAVTIAASTRSTSIHSSSSKAQCIHQFQFGNLYRRINSYDWNSLWIKYDNGDMWSKMLFKQWQTTSKKHRKITEQLPLNYAIEENRYLRFLNSYPFIQSWMWSKTWSTFPKSTNLHFNFKCFTQSIINAVDYFFLFVAFQCWLIIFGLQTISKNSIGLATSMYANQNFRRDWIKRSKKNKN